MKGDFRHYYVPIYDNGVGCQKVDSKPKSLYETCWHVAQLIDGKKVPANVVVGDNNSLNPFFWLAKGRDDSSEAGNCKAGDRAEYFEGKKGDYADLIVAYALAVQSCIKSYQEDKQRDQLENAIREVTRDFMVYTTALYTDKEKGFGVNPFQISKEGSSYGELDKIYPFSSRSKTCSKDRKERGGDDDIEVSAICRKIDENFVHNIAEGKPNRVEVNGSWRDISGYRLKGKSGEELSIEGIRVYLEENRVAFKKYFFDQIQSDHPEHEEQLNQRNKKLCGDKVPSPREYLSEAMLAVLQVVDDAPWTINGAEKGKIDMLNTIYSVFLESSRPLFKLNQAMNYIGYASSKAPSEIAPAFQQDMRMIEGIADEKGNKDIYVVNQTQQEFFKTLQHPGKGKVSFIAPTGMGKSEALGLTEAITGCKTILLPYPLGNTQYEEELQKFRNLPVGSKVALVIDDKSSISETYLSDHQKRQEYNDYVMKFLCQAYVIGAERRFEIREAHVGATVANMSHDAVDIESKLLEIPDHTLATHKKKYAFGDYDQQPFYIEKYERRLENPIRNAVKDSGVALFFPELDKDLIMQLLVHHNVSEEGVKRNFIYVNDKLKQGWEVDVDGKYTSFKFDTTKQMEEYVRSKRDYVYVFDNQNYLGVNLTDNEKIEHFHIVEYGEKSTFNRGELEQFRGRARVSGVKEITLHTGSMSSHEQIKADIESNSQLLDLRYKVKFLKPLWKAFCTDPINENFDANRYVELKNAILEGGFEGLKKFLEDSGLGNRKLCRQYFATDFGISELKQQCELYQRWYALTGELKGKKHSIEEKKSVCEARLFVLEILERSPALVPFKEQRRKWNEEYRALLLKEEPKYTAYERLHQISKLTAELDNRSGKYKEDLAARDEQFRRSREGWELDAKRKIEQRDKDYDQRVRDLQGGHDARVQALMSESGDLRKRYDELHKNYQERGRGLQELEKLRGELETKGRDLVRIEAEKKVLYEENLSKQHELQESRSSYDMKLRDAFVKYQQVELARAGLLQRQHELQEKLGQLSDQNSRDAQDLSRLGQQLSEKNTELAAEKKKFVEAQQKYASEMATLQLRYDEMQRQLEHQVASLDQENSFHKGRYEELLSSGEHRKGELDQVRVQLRENEAAKLLLEGQLQSLNVEREQWVRDEREKNKLQQEAQEFRGEYDKLGLDYQQLKLQYDELSARQASAGDRDVLLEGMRRELHAKNLEMLQLRHNNELALQRGLREQLVRHQSEVERREVESRAKLVELEQRIVNLNTVIRELQYQHGEEDRSREQDLIRLRDELDLLNIRKDSELERQRVALQEEINSSKERDQIALQELQEQVGRLEAIRSGDIEVQRELQLRHSEALLGQEEEYEKVIQSIRDAQERQILEYERVQEDFNRRYRDLEATLRQSNVTSDELGEKLREMDLEKQNLDFVWQAKFQEMEFNYNNMVHTLGALLENERMDCQFLMQTLEGQVLSRDMDVERLQTRELSSVEKVKLEELQKENQEYRLAFTEQEKVVERLNKKLADLQSGKFLQERSVLVREPERLEEQNAVRPDVVSEPKKDGETVNLSPHNVRKINVVERNRGADSSWSMTRNIALLVMGVISIAATIVGFAFAVATPFLQIGGITGIAMSGIGLAVNNYNEIYRNSFLASEGGKGESKSREISAMASSMDNSGKWMTKVGTERVNKSVDGGLSLH